MEITSDICFRPSGTAAEFPVPADYAEPEAEETTDKKWVRCRNCSSKVALIDDRIKISQADTYIFENPAGIIFRVVCFSKASGVTDVTGYTGENTWFAGYMWSVSLCSGCNSHLGWHYSSGSGDFYGLIADRLAGI